MKFMAIFKRQVPMGMGMAFGVGPYNVECNGVVDYDNGNLKLFITNRVTGAEEEKHFPDVWKFKLEKIDDRDSTVNDVSPSGGRSGTSI